MEWINFAHQLADISSGVLQKYFRNLSVFDRKLDLSPVTQADIEAESRMRDFILEHFPEHGIAGEEMLPTHAEAEYQWVLDPIDGTKAFISGYPTFTTLIALLHRGVPVLGVIDQPTLNERWIGAQGSHSLFNSAPLEPLDCQCTLAGARIATTSTFHFTPSQTAGFERLRQASSSTILGGDAYAYAMLASGHLQLVADADMKLHDYCALAPVIEGAGGVITDWAGKPLTQHSDGTVLATSNRALHEEALLLLSA